MAGPRVGVVGLGAMGSAAAFHLARAGARVVGFDRYRPPHGLGSSHGESRIIREAYFEHPDYVPLVRRAYAGWESLARTSGRPLLRTTGVLTVGPGDGPLVGGALASAREHSIPHQVYASAELRRRFPQLRTSAGDEAVYEARGGVLAVEACVRTHLEAARSHGAELRYGEPIEGWDAGSAGIILRSARGEHSVDALVLAAGPWLPRLVAETPLELERQVMAWFRGRAGESAALRAESLPVLVWETAPERVFYAVPDLGAGLKAARHHGGDRVAEVGEIDRTVRRADIAQIQEFLSDHLPAAAGRPTAATVCIYTNTPSGRFLVDRHPADPRVVVVSACSGHGFKFSPAIGASVATLVLEGTRDRDIRMFGWGEAS